MTSEELLFDAVESGNCEMAKELIAEHYDIDINWKSSVYGRGYLIIACSLGFTEIVELLLKHPKVNVNIEDEYKYTPLSAACIAKRPHLVKLLLDRPEIDVNKVNIYNMSSLWWAAWAGCLECVKYLLASNKDIDVDVRPNNIPSSETAREFASTSHYIEMTALFDAFEI
jgi:ankyrin repeat protein